MFDKLEKAIEIVKKIINRWNKVQKIQKADPKHYKTFKKCIDTQDEEIEALQTILSFLSQINDAEMPKKEDVPKYIIDTGLYNKWQAFYLKKMGERMDVERIKNVIYYFQVFQSYDVATVNQISLIKAMGKENCDNLIKRIIQEEEKTNAQSLH